MGCAHGATREETALPPQARVASLRRRGAGRYFLVVALKPVPP
jgi:hypothetical protein